MKQIIEEENKMTTPQSILHSLEWKLERLRRSLDGDCEENEDLRSIVNQIRKETSDLMSSQQRLENLMNLIIKLLAK
jgi:hypothetical protein